jgi:hypothetical protein
VPETLGVSFGYLGLVVALFTVRRWKQGRWRKALVCLAAFGVPAVLGVACTPALARLPDSFQIIALRGIGVLFAMAVWWLVPTGLWRFALTLLAAAGLGNLLSLLYPPFEIVDFMYSKVTASILHYGVFNLADLYIPVGWACLAVAAARSVLRWLRRSRVGQGDAPEGELSP